jgi:hypothetical protein
MNTFIKNEGITKTYINNNNKKYSNEMKWDGEYDGKLAKLNLNMNNNGKKEFVHMELNNQDILNILNKRTVDTPIHKRLETDFLIKNKNMRNMKKYTNKHFIKNNNKNKKYSNKNKKKFTRKIKN